MTHTVRGLLLACHPGPVVAVTVVVTGLSLFAGADAASASGLAVAVLVGQFSVGWSNDAFDASSDAAAGRREKPTVGLGLALDVLWRAAFVALALGAVLSVLLLGWRLGALHMVAVLAAWAYNLRLKDTLASPLPYAVAFGLVPVVAVGVADPTAAAPLWAVVLGAALGVGAHLANTVADIDSDRTVGRGGIAVRLGSVATRVAAVASVAIAAGAVLVGAPGAGTGWAVVLLGQVGVLAATAAVRGGRALFPVLLTLAGLNAMILAFGSR